MGKTEVKPNTKQDQILKIWYDDKEPPKSYIWAPSDGFFYIWDKDYWAAYDDLTEIKQQYNCEICEEDANKQQCRMICPCVDYITPEKLTDRLERFQRDILKYVLKMIKEKVNGGSDDSLSALIADLESRLDALENGASLNLDGYATEQWVEDKNYLTAASLNLYDLQSWVQNQHYLTQHQDISNLATKEYVDSKSLDSEEFDALATQLGYIKDSALNTLRNTVRGLQDTIGTMQSTINDLTNRLAALEAIDHSEFVTTGQGTSTEPYDDTELTNRVSALETATSDMATQTWVNNNFELKFTDLTSEQDPVAEAQLHDDDNRVYITEIETE